MSNPVTTNNPSFDAGTAAVLDSILSNLNSGVDFLYADDGIGEKGMHERHVDPAGQKLGSRTQATNILEGPVNFQLINADDTLPRPSNVILFRGNYYVISGDIGPKREKNKAIRVSVPLEQILGPVLTTCLAAIGQILVETFASGGTYTKTIAVANVRTGATKAWSLEAWTAEYPTATVPAGMTIGASTGIISYVTPVAGTYYIKIKCKDTAAAAQPVLPDRTGVGYLILTIT